MCDLEYKSPPPPPRRLFSPSRSPRAGCLAWLGPLAMLIKKDSAREATSKVKVCDMTSMSEGRGEERK